MTRRSFNVAPFEQGSEEDQYFTACAKLRNITPHAFIKRLLVAIAKDQMVAAILDDADSLQERKPGEQRFRGDSRGSHPRYGGKDYPL